MTVLVVQYGKTLQNHTSLLGDMFGVAVQALGVGGYVGLVGPDAELTAEQWKELTARMVERISVKEQMALAMESEMNSFLTTSERLAKGESLEGLDEMNLALFRFPGLFNREVRIFSNMALAPAECGKWA